MTLFQYSTGTLLASSVILSSLMNVGASELEVSERTLTSTEPKADSEVNKYEPYSTISFGKGGAAVSQLQMFLATFKYYNGKMDGLYGMLTKQAVRDYQRSHSLKPDGIAGKKTLNHLYHEHTDVFHTISQKKMSEIVHYQEDKNDTTSVLLSAAPAETLTKITELSSDLLLKVGDKGKAVTLIQQKLQDLGYYKHIDGIYGPQTKTAIINYQKAHQLNVDGIAGPQTIQHMTSDSKKKTYTDYRKTKDQRAPQNIEQERAVVTSETSITHIENTVASNNSTADVTEEAEDSSAKKPEPVEETVSTPVANSSVISTAKSLIGTPYKWGGTTRSGFDCSGFLQYVYKQHGRSIPRNTSSIWGSSTATTNPQPGDLVFFTTYQSGPSHVGIYLGNRQFIHAGSSTGVTISSIDGSYWNSRYLGARTLN
ncbi:C40 family peptidase [Alkalihalobacterium chitinilyticum]|uniref:Peptidoglycan-binding protein n=1 Tax=Alkalihalobacterium chitinilyticum TaxID=2980103 RepID=A0ABT5V8R9_9BACI|nr:peptidoglycan-binding protein [Alkalihalobacterium chitinilyticum]MDE5411863.1 peptidoglycan-binding protein [Alkalihalobacterium chitinilyticum]